MNASFDDKSASRMSKSVQQSKSDYIQAYTLLRTLLPRFSDAAQCMCFHSHGDIVKSILSKIGIGQSSYYFIYSASSILSQGKRSYYSAELKTAS